MPPKNLIGKAFHRWTVLRYVGKSYWRCRCECGTEKEVFTGNLGKSRSCGCLCDELASSRSRTHGMAKTAEYKVWAGIKRRCLNKNDKSYQGYGAKGVTVCARWSDSFEAFFADMGERPSPQHEIDRIDNSKGYEPGNCRWATRQAQANNKTRNRRITFQGVTRTSSQWSRLLGIHRTTIEFRLDSGWDVERALTTPAARGRNQFTPAPTRG